jgi:CheY-like chemotaxis protein
MPGQILVLVAEDEELVRLVIVEALEDAGFEVIEAGHADACAATNRMDCASIRMDDAGVGRRLGVARP